MTRKGNPMNIGDFTKPFKPLNERTYVKMWKSGGYKSVVVSKMFSNGNGKGKREVIRATRKKIKSRK